MIKLKIMIQLTYSGIVVKKIALKRPNFSENNPNIKVPNKAPTAKILPTHEISSEFKTFPIGDDLSCNIGNDGEAHPIDVPTDNAIIFTRFY
jgi:hypothetical protein